MNRQISKISFNILFAKRLNFYCLIYTHKIFTSLNNLKPLILNMSSESNSKKSEDTPNDKKPLSNNDDKNLDFITNFIKKSLGLTDKEEDNKSEEESEKILEDVSLDGIVDYIKKHDCKNIIVLAGAGISTSAGIPDFRSPVCGLYFNLEKYNLPHPQAIFELDYFQNNPKPFFVLAKELYPGTFKPTPCHYFVRLLNEKGLLLRIYTQNIDTLERIAGIPEEKLVEAHGTFNTGHCLTCRKEYSQQWMKEQIFKDEIPKCEDCNEKPNKNDSELDPGFGVVKPDIVFFGENLPEKFYDLREEDFDKCDLLIIMGSSLTVQPFASLIDHVKSNCPRLLINRQKVGHRDRIMMMLGCSSGLDFDNPKNNRDVAFLGDCDDGVFELAKKLGWEDELKDLVEKEHSIIDNEEIEVELEK